MNVGNESGRDGSMLEGVGREDRGRRPGQVQGGRQQKRSIQRQSLIVLE